MTAPDHIAADLRASMALADGAPDLRQMLIRSVILSSLEYLVKYDDCPVFRAAARARYCDLTDGKLPS